MDTSGLRILTLNVGNPSGERAERQLEWLSHRREQVFVLTETSAATGSTLIAERLLGAGWEVRFPQGGAGERGVLLASRARLAPRGADLVPFLPARAELVALAGGGPAVIGLYVPSRDESPEKVERKQRFIAELSRALTRAPRRAVLIGDFNVLEPAHRPRYRSFRDWEYGMYEELTGSGWADAYRRVHPDTMEYSWVGHHEDGYRFDHVFVSTELADSVVRCEYLHETRTNGLSDHSAMHVQLSVPPPECLEVDDSLSGEHLSLF